MKIDCGVAVASSSSTTIQFTKEFTERPAVVATLNAGGSGLHATTDGITTTSATFKFWNGTSQFTNGVTFSWIAIGK